MSQQPTAAVINKPLQWGILATGAIARTFARGLTHSKTGHALAVASRSIESAEKFADALSIPRRYGSYDALLADPDVQAVYIATPHPLHAMWAIRAAEARKHILVEKPIALNAAQAMAIIEAAAINDVFLMEAFMYRCHPQTVKIFELIRTGTIGEVRVIQATFSFHWPRPWNADTRLTSNALGGGGILDVGCYPVSLARLIAGAANGKAFVDPVEVCGAGHVGATGVDEWASAVLRFPGDIIAHISCGVQVEQESAVRIYGSEGWIDVPDPWIPGPGGGEQRIVVQQPGKPPREEVVQTSDWLYGLEADVVAAHLPERQAPAMSWDDSLGNMKVLDAWRQRIGVTYDVEKAEGFPGTTIGGRSLEPRRLGRIEMGLIPHLDKEMSRLVMGCDNQETLQHAAIMFDDFVERGGNAFDTAYVYGGGLQEKLLGQWVASRGVREQVVVICKGAHTPFCTPDGMTEQLHVSLDRLQMDYADIYLLHRDNLEVPAGEFVDALNQQVKAGRIRAFGGSNWSLGRMAEANEYAKKNGSQPFSVVSNNFSLARMVDPVWPGCVLASDAQSRAWLKKHQLPLLAWSSQARGFFIEGRAALGRPAMPSWFGAGTRLTTSNDWRTPTNWRQKRASGRSTSRWRTC